MEAELTHFGQAAARLHITQPALTKRIRSLEATVGPGATWEIGAVWRSDARNPALQTFLQIITTQDLTAPSVQTP